MKKCFIFIATFILLFLVACTNTEYPPIQTDTTLNILTGDETTMDSQDTTIERLEIQRRPAPEVTTPEIERNKEMILAAVSMIEDERFALRIADLMYTVYVVNIVEVNDLAGPFFQIVDDLGDSYTVHLNPGGSVFTVFKEGVREPIFAEYQ